MEKKLSNFKRALLVLLFSFVSITGWGQATLPFTYDGGNPGTSIKGLTQSGLGGDYTNSPKMKFDTTNDYLKLYFTGTGDKLSYKISFNAFSNGIFDVLESDDDVTYSPLRKITAGSTTTTFTDNVKPTTRYIKWVYTIRSSGNIGLGAINLTAASVVAAPVVAPGNINGNVGVPVSYQITASNVPQSFAISSGNLPNGLILNTSTGVISGTPTAAGTSSVYVTASNTAGTSAPAQLTFNIASSAIACFAEDFSSASSGNNTATGGSNTAWNGDDNFPITGNALVYQAGDAVRLGSSNGAGYITSKSLLSISGDVSVQLDVKGWTTKEGNIEVTLGGVTKTINDYKALLASSSFETRTLSFTSVPLNSTLKIATSTGRAFVDNVKIICTSSSGVITWNGTAWSNVEGPDATSDAVIDGDYNGESFTANNLTVNAGKNVTVNGTKVITVAGKLTNRGAIIVNDGGNFVQTASGADTNDMTGGTFTVNKNTTSAAGKYVFWASPVVGQNMFGIYPAGTPQYVMSYNTSTDYYDVLSNPAVAVAGQGYSVKVPSVGAQAAFSAEKPNNGTLTLTLSGDRNAYNLVGNPYPSNFDLVKFYNSGSNGVGSSMYFWDNLTATNTTQLQNASTWAVFNAGTGTWSQKGAYTDIADNNNSVKPGQGFIVTATAGTATMDNSMRNSADGVFVNRAASEYSKYWIGLTAPSGELRTTAVTYGGIGTEGIDAGDSKMFSVAGNVIYTVAAGNKLAIQSRPDFKNTDKVVLETNCAVPGRFTISLQGTEKLFSNGQPVILFDNVTGEYTDLSARSYTFETATAGSQKDRFVIVYGYSAGTLSASDVVAKKTEVYRNGDVFVVRAPQTISSVQVYDITGKLLESKAPKAAYTEVRTPKGVYIIKVTVGNETKTVKVLK